MPEPTDDARVEALIRASLRRRAALADPVERPDVSALLTRREPARGVGREPWLVAAAAVVLVIGVVAALLVRSDRRGDVRVVDPAGTTTTAPGAAAGPLVIDRPTGERWRRSISDPVVSVQRFTDPDWPGGTYARIDEFDTGLGPLGDISQYTIDLEAGGRVLRRFPQQPGIGERRWVEADGRGWTVGFDESPGVLPWDETTWRTELSRLMVALRYDRGSFAVRDPFVELPVGGRWLGGSWRERLMRWQTGDDRWAVTAYLDERTDIADLSGRAVTVRGRAAKFDRTSLVWREDADTVVVLGSSIRQFDDITLGDLVGRPYGGAPLQQDEAIATAEALRSASAAELARIPVWFGTASTPDVVVRSARAASPQWMIVEDVASLERSSTGAPGPDGQAVRRQPGAGPFRVWLSETRYAVGDAPACARVVDPAQRRPGPEVDLDPGCVVRAG